jgi:hypothetical protein
VLVADDRRLGADEVAAVSDHYHVAALADVVLPAVQQRAGRHLPARLLADLADHAVSGIFPEFEFPAGQLPLGPLILQQEHLPGLDRHALDRHRERAPGLTPHALARAQA